MYLKSKYMIERGIFMNYNKAYYTLFNSVSDALIHLEHQNFGQAINLLKESQQKCEDIYMESPEKD